MIVLARWEAGAAQVETAFYGPEVGQVTLIMKDGTSLTMKSGAGVEQREP
jgi:hypothetical protein